MAVSLQGTRTMRTPNEFWIALHDLAQAVAAEGKSAAERKRNIVQSFQEMPPVAQREVAAELAQLMILLPEVYVNLAPASAEAVAPRVPFAPIAIRDGTGG